MISLSLFFKEIFNVPEATVRRLRYFDNATQSKLLLSSISPGEFRSLLAGLAVPADCWAGGVLAARRADARPAARRAAALLAPWSWAAPAALVEAGWA